MESGEGRIPTDIESRSYDAIIIGAGINGAGIARDAAMRGLKVLLLDKGDISAGTTSWSSRLIHGGLRYLEYGEVGLVRESLRERECLFHIATHLVKPLPMMLPIYDGGKRGSLMVRAGMLAYDLLSFDKSLDHHRMLSRAEALRRAPGLNPNGLRGAAVYYDAQVEYAERLTLENCLSATEHGATVLTYVEVKRFVIEGAVVRGVVFDDLLGGSEYRALSKVTLNVAGPWVDQVLGGLERPPRRMIGGTKGSHIIVDAFPGGPAEALYVEAEADHRPFFIIPWNDQYLIGTTDTRFEGDLDHVEADEDEIAYLLRETNRVIPSASLTRDSVLFTYSGVRPLPYVAEGSEGGITRRHFIQEHPGLSGLLSIVGGKLTTYRSLAEQTVDAIFKKLERDTPRCRTAHEPLPGAATGDFKTFSRSFIARSPFDKSTSHRLLRVYGTRAEELLELAREDPELLGPLTEHSQAIRAEVLMSFRREMAQTLADCMMRRTMLGMNYAAGRGAAEAVAQVAQKYLAWSPQRAQREMELYYAFLERLHQHRAEKSISA
ncbi:MAG: glycerol-3-phosphate dehydrogenase [Pyrinomonadaceae bacterium]|nr:glycerol-3-phosphate dehydrogenase [Pyrinomonadaceae bacterium]